MQIFKFSYIKEKYNLVYGYISKFSEILDRNHTYMLAAGIAFNILIYAMPLFLIAIFILSNTFDVNKISFLLEDLMTEFLPPTESNFNFLKSIIKEVHLITEHSTFAGIIGIAGLLWVSSLLISSIRTGLNVVFELKDEKIFILYRIKDMILTVVFALLIMLYSYALPIVSFIIDFMGSALNDEVKQYYSSTVFFLISVFISFVIFFIIFRLVPNDSINKKVGMLSTIICVFGIEIMRHIFAFYITSITNYGKFYGTYAVLISLAVWIYYTALIILLSGEISMYIFRKDIELEKEKKAIMSEPKNNW